MSGVAVKTEDFVSLDTTVRLVTYQAYSGSYFEYTYAIVKNGEIVYLSPIFHGFYQSDVARSCDNALDVVRVLLKETGFLTGKVVGA